MIAQGNLSSLRFTENVLGCGDPDIPEVAYNVLCTFVCTDTIEQAKQDPRVMFPPTFLALDR